MGARVGVARRFLQHVRRVMSENTAMAVDDPAFEAELSALILSQRADALVAGKLIAAGRMESERRT